MTGHPIADQRILITGANRGLGLALVDEALRRGAAKVYAGMRRPVTHADPRVAPGGTVKTLERANLAMFAETAATA